MQRIGETRWRPLELCWWPEQGKLPAKGKEYPSLGYKRLRDKPPKTQPAVAHGMAPYSGLSKAKAATPPTQTRWLTLAAGLVAGYILGMVIMETADVMYTSKVEHAMHAATPAEATMASVLSPLQAAPAPAKPQPVSRQLDIKPAGDTIHSLLTSNGSPYQGFQTRIMYGTYKLVQAMPGGEKLTGFTRVMHRTTDDFLMDEVPTFRAQPLHPKCDEYCDFPVADRANAVVQWIQAVKKDPSMLKGAWVLLLESDYVWMKPVRAPDAASSAPGFQYAYDYIQAEHPNAAPHIKKLFGSSAPAPVPNSGPAPALLRFSELEVVAPEWERVTALIEEDKAAVDALGWVREMYAWDVALALHPDVKMLTQEPYESVLLVQPPHEDHLGNASMCHYTWGAIYNDSSSTVWRWEKRDYTALKDALKPPQAPRSSQEATPAAASKPGPSTPPPAKRSKRIKAEQAAEPTHQPTKGKANGKAAKAKPAPQPGRWLDRDCNAALNMHRVGESRWRPLELCWWPEQGSCQPEARSTQAWGYKRLRDKPPKTKQEQPAVAQLRAKMLQQQLLAMMAIKAIMATFEQTSLVEESGLLDGFYRLKLTRSLVRHDSGLTQASRNTLCKNDNTELQLQYLAAASPAGTSLVANQQNVAVTPALEAVWESTHNVSYALCDNPSLLLVPLQRLVPPKASNDRRAVMAGPRPDARCGSAPALCVPVLFVLTPPCVLACQNGNLAWLQVIKVPEGAVLRGCKKTRRKLREHLRLRAEIHSQLRFIASLFVLRIFLTCLVGYPTPGYASAPQPPAVQPPQPPDAPPLPPLPPRAPAQPAPAQPASMECDNDSDSESHCDSDPESQSDSESESEPEPVTQPPQRRCSARLAALAPAAPTGPPLPLDCEDPVMLRQLKDFCKFFANLNFKTCYNQLQRRLVRDRHPMLMPAFEDPSNQALLSKLQELCSIKLTGFHNTLDAHSMQLAVAMQQHYSNPGKASPPAPPPQDLPYRVLSLRDCNAALNMQRIGESMWRPLELCYWPDQGALPAKGKEYPGLGYKRLRDKPPKAKEQQQPAPVMYPWPSWQGLQLSPEPPAGRRGSMAPSGAVLVATLSKGAGKLRDRATLRKEYPGGLMTSDEGHQFKRDGGQWQPVPQGLVPHGGGGRGGPLRGRRGDDQWDRGYDQSSHGKAGVAMAVEAHGEARAVAAKEAQEVVAAREALGVVAVRGDGKEARVASRVAAKAVGKEATVAKEVVGWVALSSQHLLLPQCFTSLMSHLPQVHATVSIERSVTPVAAKILPEMLEGIDLILGADWQKSHGAVLDVGSNICHIKVGNKLHKLHSQHHKFRPGAAVLAAVADSGEAVKVLSAKQAARALRKGCCSVLALVQPSAANDDEGWYNGSLASVLVNNQEGCERPGLVPASVIDSMVHEEFPTVFQDMPAGLPPDRGVGHTIRLEPGHAPPYQRARRYSLKEMDEMRKQVAELLAKKLIEPSSSPYGAPVLFVQKRDGTLRMCIDFRALNKLTVRDRYPLPRIDDLFDRVQGKTVFSSLDLQSGYHQIRITPEDVPKTAFVTPGGQFQYKVLCFGLTNAPATFQRVMNRIFEKQLLAGTVLVYLDDILVMSRSPAEHVQHLREVLQVMKDNNLYAKLSKCEFNKPELKFLGHIVGRHGIAVDPAKVQVIQDWAMPTCLKELQAFLGLANFFRRFIAGYSTIAAPLTDLTGEAVAAGTNWRQLSVLMQNGRVVAYTSHKFTPAQVKYTTGEQELLGIIRAMQEWRCYLDGAVHVTIVTDHNPLIYLKTQTNLSRRQARWMEFLARFDHHIEYKPGKGNVADPLSRNPGLTHHDDDDDGQPILLTMGAQLCVSGVYAMVMTRRQAGLQVQPPFQPPPVPPSQPAAPRKQKRQQKRARCASGGQPPPSVVPCDKWPDGGEKQLDSATHTPAGKTHSTTQGSSLVKAIINGYSTDDRFADRAYTQAYELSETGLWMSGGKVVVPKSPLVKREVLEACHDAKYAGHMGMSKTWHTVDLSFTWPGMRKDVEDYVRQCDACQRNKPSTRLKAGKLQPLSIPGRRWESVSMDFIVKLPKSGERGFDSILVFVDRLSKMVHLVPTKESISAFDMATHFFHEVVRLHGMPASVITDRGPHFNSHFWEHVCALCKVAHYMSSAYHPESDGQTERVNRVIEEMLRHYVNDAHTDWAEHLPWVEFAINNSWHESIRQTPFFLNYGQHPLTPATLDLPRKVPKASAFAENVEKEVHKARQCWREAQQRMKALVDGKRREVTYKPEQLVMLSTVNMRKRKDEVGVRKLKPRYVGPFVVLRMIGLVAVQIQLPHRWTRMHNVFHVSLVKPYLGTQAPNMAAPPTVQWLDGEPVYEVEKLLQHKLVKVRGRGNGKGRKPSKNVKQALEFLVRWVGYSEEHDTWEPQKNLVNCDEALQQYIDEHGPLPTLGSPTYLVDRRRDRQIAVENSRSHDGLHVDRWLLYRKCDVKLAEGSMLAVKLLVLVVAVVATVSSIKAPCPAFTLRGRSPLPNPLPDARWCIGRQLGYSDGTMHNLLPRDRPRRIIDSIIFNDELELLDIRLHTLWDVVDTFVIVESNKTFSNKSKPLHFAENAARYTEFMRKIHHFVMVDPPHLHPGPWEREHVHRRAQANRNESLKGVPLSTGDLVLMSDVDEVADPALLAALKSCQGVDVELFCLDLRFSLYSCKCELDQFHSKLSSYSHMEFDTPANRYPATLINRIVNGLDIAGRASEKFERPGRWLDRDCNAALNMQRIGESMWRPLELCYWPEQGKLPAKGKEYPGLGYKRLRDKPPKAKEQQQPANGELLAALLLGVELGRSVQASWSAQFQLAAIELIGGEFTLSPDMVLGTKAMGVKWLERLFRARLNRERCSYAAWFKHGDGIGINHMAPHLPNRQLSTEVRTSLTRFRLGNSGLGVEKARFEWVTFIDRTCTRCTEGIVDDAMHFIFVCTATSSIRQQPEFAMTLQNSNENLHVFILSPCAPLFVHLALKCVTESPEPLEGEGGQAA
ncbi:hypothetical protein QJQ45_022308 [Haematococcus lacustris]|nr:hypothetical protein QJQ45_022308 [Haematococcus lacustris]